MKISLNWLKRYIPLTVGPAELETALAMLGFEVESVQTIGLPPLEHVVVGEVLSREQHPGADRLGVCQVDVGDGVHRTIVCAATNYTVGDRVPVALPGAVLPGGFTIKEAKLRGVLSQGMMCSAREMGLGGDEGGLLILKNRPMLGTPINALFPECDYVLDLSITANRGDALCHVGIARELAAYYELDLKLPTGIELQKTTSASGALKALEVRSSKDCPLYTALTITGIKNTISPEWMRKDLEAVGMRAINLIVDIGNWVMLETGQPLHAFDADKIAGETLVVRRAKPGESITLLNGSRLDFNEDGLLPLVIADAEKPLVIAAVMGSTAAQVDENTTRIVLESAYFEPSQIRRVTRDLGISSESSYRFERDIDPAGLILGASRVAQLLIELAGAQVDSAITAVGEAPRGPRQISVTADFIEGVLGFPLEKEAIKNYLIRAGFSVRPAGEAGFHVIVPSFRSDVTRPVDLAEEVLRFHGTTQIPASRVHLESLDTQPIDDPIHTLEQASMTYLCDRGFAQCQHYTLRSEREAAAMVGEEKVKLLELSNPLSADQSHLRPSLIPGLMDAAALNLNHKNDVRALCEFGHVFTPQTGGITEHISIALVALREPSVRLWNKAGPMDFHTLKPLVEPLAQMAGIGCLNWQPYSGSSFHGVDYAARVGDLVQDGFTVELGLIAAPLMKLKDLAPNTLLGAQIILSHAILRKNRGTRVFKAFSDFPPVKRDIALIVEDGVLSSAVKVLVEGIAREIIAARKAPFALESVELFDVYNGAGIEGGKKSFAFNLTFRSETQTLADTDVAPVFESLTKALESHYTVRTA